MFYLRMFLALFLSAIQLSTFSSMASNTDSISEKRKRRELLKEMNTNTRKASVSKERLSGEDSSLPPLPEMKDVNEGDKKFLNKGRFYVRAGGSLVQLKDKSTVREFKDTVPMYELAFGFRFNPVLRADISFDMGEIVLNGSGTNLLQSTKMKIQHYSGMLNGYFNLSEPGLFEPYLVGGLGYGYNKPKNSSLTSGVSTIASKGKAQYSVLWSAGVGTIINFNRHIGLDLSCKYGSFGDIKSTISLNGSYAGKTNISNIKGGRYNVGIVINF